MKIYTDRNTSVDVQVSEGSKWYTYLLPKYKGLYKIEGGSVKKVVVKADISFEGTSLYPYVVIIPSSTVEASFKGSNTSNVTAMTNMFYECSGLTSLDLSNFDNSNVIDMYNMFYKCSGLTSLDLSGFNTSNVTSMRGMFEHCSKLTSLDLSKWDTSKVTGMVSMFTLCTNLETLDLSGWDIRITDMSSMFEGCANLKTIRMKGCSKDTIDKIKEQLKTDGITVAKIETT